jgi:tyrosine-protein phosphatase YwqE
MEKRGVIPNLRKTGKRKLLKVQSALDSSKEQLKLYPGQRIAYITTTFTANTRKIRVKALRKPVYSCAYIQQQVNEWWAGGGVG